MKDNTERSFILRSDDIRTRCIEYVESLDLRTVFECVIRPHKAKRTLAQNRLYWMWLHLIAGFVNENRKETPEDLYDEDDLHEWFKQKFIPPRVIEINGEPHRVRKSTTRLNVEKMSEYLNNIDQYCAATLSLVLPRPEDMWREAMGRHS